MGVLTVNTDFEKLYGFPERELYAKQYLTFEALEDGSIDFIIPYEVLNNDGMYSVSYSTDNGETWVIKENNYEEDGIDIQVILTKGDKVLFKGVADSYGYYDDDSDEYYFSHFYSSGDFKVYGNIMSLFYNDDYVDKTAFQYAYACAGLFNGNDTLIMDAKNLILPATTLTDYCYSEMFRECTALTTAPELPATTLAPCCYGNMFISCTSLTLAPELPATELVNNCYLQMFNGCTSLNYIKAMFTTTPSNTYTMNWVKNVAATGTFVKNKDAEWNVSGTYGVPTGWTVETA